MSKKEITIVKAAENFIAELEALGKKPSTIGTSRRTLDLLVACLGEDKQVGKILPVHISKFFGSEAATKQPGKDGLKPRAQASVLQIRRIVRQFMVYLVEQKHLDKIALPKDELERGGGVRQPAAETEPAEAE